MRSRATSDARLFAQLAQRGAALLDAHFGLRVLSGLRGFTRGQGKGEFLAGKESGAGIPVMALEHGQYV